MRSGNASLACVPTWGEDFRKDLERVDVPTLVIHGDEDRIVPLTAAGARTAKMIKGARLYVVKGGPHCITWTHAEEVNAQLLSFLGEKAQAKKKSPERPRTMSCRAITAQQFFQGLIAKGKNMTNRNEVAERREAPLRTPSLLGADDVRNITAELNVLLADVFRRKRPTPLRKL